MNEKEAWFLSKIVAVIVLALGYVSYWTISSPDYEDLLKINPNISDQRTPASFVSVSPLKTQQHIPNSVMSTVDLNCIRIHDKDKSSFEIKSHSNQVRLIGRFCDLPKPEEHKEIFISNTSNGSDATVFPLPNSHFSTDYVYLNEGRNRFVISTVEPKTQSLLAIREIYIEKLDVAATENASSISYSK